MVPSGKLGTSLPFRLGTISEEESVPFGFGQAQARIIDNDDCNTTSPTGDVLVVTGLTETILPGCDIWVSTPAGVALSWNIWISHQNSGTFKQELITIKRDNIAGATLDSFSTPAGSDGGDNTNGHQFNWTGTFIDSSPTTGHYVISVTEIAVGVGDPTTTQIWSDTRTFCATRAGAAYGFGQAQTTVLKKSFAFGQAQALIVVVGINTFGQSQAEIVYKRWAFGQAQAQILLKRFVLGQAQARILQIYLQPAQAQALIVVRNISKFAQAAAEIVYKRWSFAQAQAIIVHGYPGGGDTGDPSFSPPHYIVVYNGFQLPGYAQAESLVIQNQLADPSPFAWDGTRTQQDGLSNSTMEMEFLIYTKLGWTHAKDQVHMAKRILFSEKMEFAPLYVDYTDRHWLAKVISVDYSKDVSSAMKILKYTVKFETLPWILGDTEHTLIGSIGTISTTGRTFSDGAWTPLTMVVSGTNVTVSGYTATEFTGFISVSGIVSNLEIDTENFTATIGDNNAIDKMYWQDFSLFVGAGITNFEITGASSVTITYKDRWY